MYYERIYGQKGFFQRMARKTSTRNSSNTVVTGATRSVHLDKLYKEISWLSLADRRHYQKLLHSNSETETESKWTTKS